MGLLDESHSYTFWLPDNTGSRKEHQCDSNSLIIIGPNGSGKSKLGAWIEQQNYELVHRIAAQRSLNFSEHVPLKSYSEAEDEVFYGTKQEVYKQQKQQRWNWGKSTTTKMLDDFDSVLSAVMAKLNSEEHDFTKECRLAEQEKRDHPNAPVTILDKLLAIWDKVFPHRQLSETDASFYASISKEESERYSATQMGDGERSVLYLVAQVLCVPDNKILVIDEPELHLHPSLMMRLWSSLETARPDCLFVYMTHSVDFASQHGVARKVWVKSFDGANWDWEFVEKSELPESLLLDLMGNRRRVLFVEGDGSSLDVQLYSALYPEYYIVPRGGCEQVISSVRAFRQTDALHNYQAFGIIDRDYRADEGIAVLSKSGVYCLDYAEVENVFLSEDVVRYMAEHMAGDANAVFSRVRDYVVSNRFSAQIDKQIREATVYRLKGLLGGIEITDASTEEARESFQEALARCDFGNVYDRVSVEYREVLESGEYEQILEKFNEKGLSGTVGHFLGIDNKKYCSLVVGLLGMPEHGKLLQMMMSHVPTLPEK